MAQKQDKGKEHFKIMYSLFWTKITHFELILYSCVGSLGCQKNYGGIVSDF